MSIYNKLQKEHDVLYRKHKVVEDNGWLCEDCHLNVWDDDFPEYCIGPTTDINPVSFDTNEEVYTIKGKLFHLHNKALIEFATPGVIDDNFVMDIDLDDLNDLIKKLSKISAEISSESK